MGGDDAREHCKTGKLADDTTTLEQDRQVAESWQQSVVWGPHQAALAGTICCLSVRHAEPTGTRKRSRHREESCTAGPHLLLVCQKRRACLTHEPDLAELGEDDPSVEVHQAEGANDYEADEEDEAKEV